LRWGILPKDYLSPEEAAETLGLSPETIRAYIRSGELPAYRFGKRYRIRTVDFDEFVKSHSTKERKDDKEK